MKLNNLTSHLCFTLDTQLSTHLKSPCTTNIFPLGPPVEFLFEWHAVFAQFDTVQLSSHFLQIFFHWFWKSVLEKDLWHHKHTGANPCLVLTFANVMRHEKFSGAYTDKWLYGQVGNTYWNTLEINMLVCVCVSPVWSFRASCPYQLGLCSSPLATLHINCSS